jgi:GTP-binding protein YchF
LTDKSVSGEYLTQLQNVDALINVVRSFRDDSIPHPQGSIDVGRDMASMELELAFSDLAIIERRLNRIGSAMKSPKAEERHAAQLEKDLMNRIKADLENDIPIREQKLSEEEHKLISGYQFLSAKPMLTIVNIGEDELPHAAAIEEDLNKRFARPDQHIIALCGKLEMELALLDEASAAAFRQDYGLAESGLGRAIRASFRLLGLINFFTTGPDEVKAWPIKDGTVAQKAAGKIHSDIERGFIRAEVIGYDDLMQCGTMAEGRKHGLLRQEGKTYIVKDGDIINFLFNV